MGKQGLILLAVIVILAGFIPNVKAAPFVSSTFYSRLNESNWVNDALVIMDTNESLNNIIANLTEEDLQLQEYGSYYLFYLIGNISRGGFEILYDNPNVSRIIMNMGATIATNNSENQSCTPSVFIHPDIIPALDKEGSVYVAVGIKDTSGIVIDSGLSKAEKINLSNQMEEYNIKIRQQIMDNLTNDEFNITRISRGYYYFSGYITQKGLEKLNASCYIENIVIPLTGGTGDEGNQTLPYVDPEIIYQLNENGEINVIIYLDNPSTIDDVIASLPPNDSQLIKKMEGSIGFVARINKMALDVLSNNGDIQSIYWDRTMTIQPAEPKIESTPQENQTEIKTVDEAKPQSIIQRIISFFKSLFRWS